MLARAISEVAEIDAERMRNGIFMQRICKGKAGYADFKCQNYISDVSELYV